MRTKRASLIRPSGAAHVRHHGTALCNVKVVAKQQKAQFPRNGLRCAILPRGAVKRKPAGLANGADPRAHRLRRVSASSESGGGLDASLVGRFRSPHTTTHRHRAFFKNERGHWLTQRHIRRPSTKKWAEEFAIVPANPNCGGAWRNIVGTEEGRAEPGFLNRLGASENDEERARVKRPIKNVWDGLDTRRRLRQFIARGLIHIGAKSDEWPRGSHAEKETWSDVAGRLIDANEVPAQIVREQRGGMSLHQFARIQDRLSVSRCLVMSTAYWSCDAPLRKHCKHAV